MPMGPAVTLHSDHILSLFQQQRLPTAVCCFCYYYCVAAVTAAVAAVAAVTAAVAVVIQKNDNHFS